mmetsp:Transcript_27794/g.50160  ORF Transcript_27794/g.50160 Transcript_27794/m.50160 type:complete len:220 (+) Transcript_27794:406-1065(+)
MCCLQPRSNPSAAGDGRPKFTDRSLEPLPSRTRGDGAGAGVWVVSAVLPASQRATAQDSPRWTAPSWVAHRAASGTAQRAAIGPPGRVGGMRMGAQRPRPALLLPPPHLPALPLHVPRVFFFPQALLPSPTPLCSLGSSAADGAAKMVLLIVIVATNLVILIVERSVPSGLVVIIVLVLVLLRDIDVPAFRDGNRRMPHGVLLVFHSRGRDNGVHVDWG